MSDHTLPEDLSRWPKDPYQLLGVDAATDPRTLRRVYTRLIRTYKPEQYPEHFRRIREAYEIVLRHAEFFRSIRRMHEDDEEADETPAPMPNSPTDAASSLEIEELPAPREWRPAPEPAEDLDLLWQRACAGEEAVVYRRLVALLDAKPGQVDVLLRLYWLLALTPDLDPKRVPCDWLVHGLGTTGLSGSLWELYRRAIVDDPEEALSERCVRLLRSATSAGRLADLAEWRWQAACRRGRWNVLDDDLEFLYGRLAIDEPETWLRLLITATEQLTALPGDGPRRLAQECQKQIEHFDNGQTSLADDLDRLEFYRDVAADLQKLESWSLAPQELIRLVTQSWTRTLVELRPLLLVYLEHISRYPPHALRELDTVRQKAPKVLAQFSYLLTLYRGSLDRAIMETRSRAVLAGLARDFLDENHRENYDDLRPLLLNFCLGEAVAPEAMVEFVDADLAQQVTDDWPLRCVFTAWQLFWA